MGPVVRPVLEVALVHLDGASVLSAVWSLNYGFAPSDASHLLSGVENNGVCLRRRTTAVLRSMCSLDKFEETCNVIVVHCEVGIRALAWCSRMCRTEMSRYQSDIMVEYCVLMFQCLELDLWPTTGFRVGTCGVLSRAVHLINYDLQRPVKWRTDMPLILYSRPTLTRQAAWHPKPSAISFQRTPTLARIFRTIVSIIILSNEQLNTRAPIHIICR